ncbi:MAG: hypothetical protein M3Y72_17440 [Acidobacteriota bacterium]|nr:hypothetical protein [Acidobacteriota bacterium]
MKWLIPLIAFFAFTVSAADISGTWKGTAETPNGSVERTFTFKVDGTKLTGETTSNMMGKSVLHDGKIEGDNVSFYIEVDMQGQQGKIEYKGKVSGDKIDFTAEVPSFSYKVEYTAKRVANGS